MRVISQFRYWREMGLCCLLCLALQGFGIAETETSTPPKKPSQTATKPVAKKPSTSAHKTTTHSTSKRTASHPTKSAKRPPKKRGQQAIDPTRAREIQTALIREHYMQGEPTGTWDAATQAAMQRYQADQGWQSKTTPDSRALIKLGLGPSHDHLLNPESAMTTSAAPAAGDPKAVTKQAPPENSLPQQ